MAKKKSRKALVIAIAVIGVAIVGVGIVAALKLKKGGNPMASMGLTNGTEIFTPAREAYASYIGEYALGHDTYGRSGGWKSNDNIACAKCINKQPEFQTLRNTTPGNNAQSASAWTSLIGCDPVGYSMFPADTQVEETPGYGNYDCFVKAYDFANSFRNRCGCKTPLKPYPA